MADKHILISILSCDCGHPTIKTFESVEKLTGKDYGKCPVCKKKYKNDKKIVHEITGGVSKKHEIILEEKTSNVSHI